MKRLAALVFMMLAAVLSSARAQDSADDQYLVIYGLIERADALSSSGNAQQALTGFADAQSELQKFQKIYPDWNPKIVNFRLNYLAEKIAELTPQLPVANAPLPTATATNNVSAAPANWQSQLDVLREQLQNAQADNSTLTAKLKEALAAQPAIIDPRELAKAQEQIRSLMKENDLLKASLTGGQAGTTAAGLNTNDFAQIQAALAAANQKLSDETARAGKLALENQSLQSRLQSLLASPDALEALHEENALLKKQVADLTAAATNSASVADLTLQLADARAQIARLQTNIEVVSLEKLALEDKVRQLQPANPAPPAPPDQGGNEARVRELTQERDDLLTKLDAANKEIYGRKNQKTAAKIDQLTDEIDTLHSRLAVDESQAVPYTADELALLKQPSPQLANPNAEKKSVKELPSGSAALVAEAHNYFAAKQYDKAEDDYLKILQHDQNNGLVLANLATIELYQNKLDDAEKHAQTALAQGPNDAFNLAILGKVKFAEGKFDDALDLLSRAAKLDPQNPELENYLGAALAQKGLRAQAETAFRKAVELDPDYAPAHNNLAMIYISQQPPLAQLARWHYQKALDAGQPRNPDLEKLLADHGAAVNPQ